MLPHGFQRIGLPSALVEAKAKLCAPELAWAAAGGACGDAGAPGAADFAGAGPGELVDGAPAVQQQRKHDKAEGEKQSEEVEQEEDERSPLAPETATEEAARAFVAIQVSANAIASARTAATFNS